MSDATSAPAAVIILAAGAGTRMKSKTPKIMHPIGGTSMVGHALAAAHGLEPQQLVAVVRHQRDKVAAHLDDLAAKNSWELMVADQDEVPGTGRAVQALSLIHICRCRRRLRCRSRWSPYH